MSGKMILNLGIGLLLVAAIVFAIVASQHPQEPSTQAVSPEASASAVPGTTVQVTAPAQAPTPAPAPLPSATPTNPLAMSNQDPFAKRVLDYEEVYQSPRTTEREAKLAQYATQAYMTARQPPASPAEERGKDIVVRIDRDPTHTEVLVTPPDPSATTRQVTVTATASTVRHDANGQETVVFDSLALPIHATTWVLEQGIWKVSSER